MNEVLKKLISDRLDIGAKKYGEELDVNDGRDWIKESLEEQLDSIVYTAAKLLQLQKKIKDYGPPYSMANKSGKEIKKQTIEPKETVMIIDSLEEMSSTLYLSGENAKSSEYSGLARKLRDISNHHEPDRFIKKEDCEVCE